MKDDMYRFVEHLRHIEGGKLAIHGKNPKFQVQVEPEKQALRRKAGRTGGFLKTKGYNDETLKFQWGYMRFTIFSVVNPEHPVELVEWSFKNGWKVAGLQEIIKQAEGPVAPDEIVNYAEDRT